jgi:hypothetical protein
MDITVLNKIHPLKDHSVCKI